MKAQSLQDALGVGNQRLQLFITFVWPREFEHFYLLELMLALQAARVLSGCPGLGAKASRPGAELDGQRVGVECFLTIETGELNLRRRRQPQVGALQMKHVRREFRQLTHARERSEERRVGKECR